MTIHYQDRLARSYERGVKDGFESALSLLERVLPGEAGLSSIAVAKVIGAMRNSSPSVNLGESGIGLAAAFPLLNHNKSLHGRTAFFKPSDVNVVLTAIDRIGLVGFVDASSGDPMVAVEDIKQVGLPTSVNGERFSFPAWVSVLLADGASALVESSNPSTGLTEYHVVRSGGDIKPIEGETAIVIDDPITKVVESVRDKYGVHSVIVLGTDDYEVARPYIDSIAPLFQGVKGHAHVKHGGLNVANLGNIDAEGHEIEHED